MPAPRKPLAVQAAALQAGHSGQASEAWFSGGFASCRGPVATKRSVSEKVKPIQLQVAETGSHRKAEVGVGEKIVARPVAEPLAVGDAESAHGEYRADLQVQRRGGREGDASRVGR